MTISGTGLIGVWAGMAVGNFLYQTTLKKAPDWGAAVSISYFQGAMALAIWAVTRLSVWLK